MCCHSLLPIVASVCPSKHTHATTTTCKGTSSPPHSAHYFPHTAIACSLLLRPLTASDSSSHPRPQAAATHRRVAGRDDAGGRGRRRSRGAGGSGGSRTESGEAAGRVHGLRTACEWWQGKYVSV